MKAAYVPETTASTMELLMIRTKCGWILCCLTFVVLSMPPSFAQNYSANWKSLDGRPTPEWFTDAKFGIFIHWGVYSVPAWGSKGSYSEWYWKNMEDKNGETYKHHIKTYGGGFLYQDFAPMFKADLFNPDQWAELFLESGARYIVPTSKHHEGFCLWPSAESWNWNSVDVGPHRDLLGELTTAVRARGLKTGFYYSLYEWYNPLYLHKFPRYVNEHFFPQFKDVVTRYQPSIIFADGEWEHTSAEWKTPELIAWLFNESAVKNEVVINDRWGSDTRSSHGGYFTTEYGLYANKEMTISHPWEENRGIGSSFGYNRNEDVGDYRTVPELIEILTTTVSQGGNLLLDIGPAADGTIPVIMQERLREIGGWLKVNGEAIYASRPFRTWSEGANIRFTRSKNGEYLYMICLNTLGQSVKSRFAVPAINTTVEMLGVNANLNWRKEGDEMIVDIPDSILLRRPCDYAWALKMKAGPYADKPDIVSAKRLSESPITVSLKAAPGCDIRYTLDGSEPGGYSETYQKPLVLNERKIIKARAFKSGFAPSMLSEETFVVVDPAKNGLRYDYYEGKWSELPDFHKLKSLRRGRTYEIDLKSIERRTEEYGLMFEGSIKIDKEGEYTLFLSSDDGSRLTIDGAELVNNDGEHGVIEKAGTIRLSPGKHSLRIQFFQRGGGDSIELKYEGPGIPKQKVPADLLFVE